MKQAPVFCRTLSLVVVLALSGDAVDAWARLPRPYENCGVIEAVDVKDRTLRLVEPAKPKCPLGQIIKPMEFTWTDQTVFRRENHAIQAHELCTGQRVRVFYRFPSKGKPFLVELVVDEPSPNQKEQR
jgi:hypothetical protein